MNEQMWFPKNIKEFIDDYSFKDKEEIYTNGSQLIQVFRVEQALEHYYQPYKDIEEELGIDLITLFKALKQGVYFNEDKKLHAVFLDVGSLGDFRLSYQVIDDLFFAVYVKDYGKTWALTKEELELL